MWTCVCFQIKLIDMFLACIFATGACQVLYCLLVGTFPFNSFLAGFISTLGVFVFTGLQNRDEQGMLTVCKIGMDKGCWQLYAWNALPTICLLVVTGVWEAIRRWMWIVMASRLSSKWRTKSKMLCLKTANHHAPLFRTHIQSTHLHAQFHWGCS